MLYIYVCVYPGHDFKVEVVEASPSPVPDWFQTLLECQFDRPRFHFHPEVRTRWREIEHSRRAVRYPRGRASRKFVVLDSLENFNFSICEKIFREKSERGEGGKAINGYIQGWKREEKMEENIHGGDCRRRLNFSR